MPALISCGRVGRRAIRAGLARSSVARTVPLTQASSRDWVMTWCRDSTSRPIAAITNGVMSR